MGLICSCIKCILYAREIEKIIFVPGEHTCIYMYIHLI